MEDKLIFNLPEIKADLVLGISECNKRGLVHSGRFPIYTNLYVDECLFTFYNSCNFS